MLVPVPKKPAPNEGEYLLVPKRAGGYEYDDFNFRAHIAPDGHVTFRDKHFRLETRVFGVLVEKYRRAGDGRRLGDILVDLGAFAGQCLQQAALAAAGGAAHHAIAEQRRQADEFGHHMPPIGLVAAIELHRGKADFL